MNAGENEMTRLKVDRARLRAPLFVLVALVLAFVPISAFAQNYAFDSASVYARASSQADGVAGGSYTVAEQCNPGCNGGKLSSAGFKDSGLSKQIFLNATAKGTATNNTTATTDANNGVTLTISDLAHAEAFGLGNDGYASSPFPYKGPDQPWFDGATMFMAWKGNKNSTLRVNNLVGKTTLDVNGGQHFENGSWTITVTTQCCGIVIATYDQETNGSTFNADIPANTVVKISWAAQAGAKAAYDNVLQKVAWAKIDASVTGTVTIGQ